jgi:hypothetical protein
MKTLPNIFQNPARRIFIAVTVTALLITTGCVVFYQEDDGDKEPELGYYYVSVTPHGKTVLLDPQSSSISIPVFVSGTCVGKNPPPGCDADPDWHGVGIAGVNVSVAHPHQRDTAATITIDVPSFLYLQQYCLTATGHRLETQFLPKVPRGMKLSGNWSYWFTLHIPSPTTDRTEEPADKPRLGAWPEKLKLFPSVALPNPERAVEIYYNGPETILETPSITGPGASKWLVNVPNSLLTGDGKGPTVTVKFIGPGGGNNEAFVIFSTRAPHDTEMAVSLSTQ